MNTTELKRARAFIKANEWKFSKTMPQWPHEYVVRQRVNDVGEYLWFLKLIEKYGKLDSWAGRWEEHYLVIDKKKYWGWDDGDGKGGVVNRAEPISNKQMIENGKEYVKKYGTPKRFYR